LSQFSRPDDEAAKPRSLNRAAHIQRPDDEAAASRSLNRAAHIQRPDDEAAAPRSLNRAGYIQHAAPSTSPHLSVFVQFHYGYRINQNAKSRQNSEQSEIPSTLPALELGNHFRRPIFVLDPHTNRSIAQAPNRTNKYSSEYLKAARAGASLDQLTPDASCSSRRTAQA
jgi:hypothetical protein